MPRHSMPRLEMLCIRNIARKWPQVVDGLQVFSKNELYKGESPFRCLPEALLHQLTENVVLAQCRNLVFSDFFLLVCRPLTQLNCNVFNHFHFSKSEVVLALYWLSEIAYSLQELTLSDVFIRCAYVRNISIGLGGDVQIPQTIAALHTFLEAARNVVSLNFEMTKCQDWMLEVVADNCLNLQELNLTNCAKVTNNGILSFCKKNATNHEEDGERIPHRAAAFKLQKLWLVGTQITLDAIVDLLSQLPFLRLCHHPHLFGALEPFFGPDWPMLLQYKMSNLCSLLSDFVCDRAWLTHLHQAQRILNAITHLKLVGLNSSVDLQFLESLDNLQDLTLCADINSVTCGTNLSSVAASCLKLKRLSLFVREPLKLTLQLPGDAFQYLEVLEMDYSGSSSLSATDAVQLLSHCLRLQKVILHSSPWLTDKILDDLLRLNPLRQIKEMVLYETNLSVDGLRRLLDLRNSMRTLRIYSHLIGSRHIRFFNDYIQSRNLDLSFELLLLPAPYIFYDTDL